MIVCYNALHLLIFNVKILICEQQDLCLRGVKTMKYTEGEKLNKELLTSFSYNDFLPGNCQELEYKEGCQYQLHIFHLEENKNITKIGSLQMISIIFTMSDYCGPPSLCISSSYRAL